VSGPAHLERGAWSVERGAWSVERGAWSVERGAWSVERGAQVPVSAAHSKRLMRLSEAEMSHFSKSPLKRYQVSFETVPSA